MIYTMFFAADFELFTSRYQGDEEWNGSRLAIRRRLQTLGNEVCAEYATLGVALDRRESLHHPHHTNGKRVRRQRTMIFRDKKSRKKLQSFLGKDLGKDLNSARNNVHMQICIDDKQCWWGIRIDESAWYALNVPKKIFHAMKSSQPPSSRKTSILSLTAAERVHYRK
jgi:hypothetical protein